MCFCTPPMQSFSSFCFCISPIFLGRAAIAAFLFAVHPAHVESVAWLAERKDLLCAFFSLIALLVYVWYVRSPSWKRLAWVVLASACALMSKPMAVTLPFIMLLLDYWPLRRVSFTQQTHAARFSSLRKLFLEKWPLFILAIFSSVVTFLAQRSGGSVIILEAFPMWVRFQQRGYQLLPLFTHRLLALSAHGLLLPRQNSYLNSRRCAIRHRAISHHSCLLAHTQDETLLPLRMAVVSRNACAGHRHCASRSASHG